MSKLLNIIKEDSTTLYSFTSEGIKVLFKFFTGSLPIEGAEYCFSSGVSNDYVLYKNLSLLKTSATITNKQLAHFIDCCNRYEPSCSIQQVKPTVEQIYQDIAFNMSVEDQHKLANMIASNVGYVLCADNQEIEVIGLGKTINDALQHAKSLIEPKEIDSGGACDYYRVGVTHPMSSDQKPYIAECGDIIESLEMTYAEANVFKEIWRTAAERTLGLKKAGNTNVRAAEKVVFFANRYYVQNVHKANLTDSRKVNK